MQLSTHLGFNGQCEEAFKFYEKVLGGKIVMMMPYGGSPAENAVPAEHRNKIMHARLMVDGQALMGADAPPGHEGHAHGYSVSVQVNDAAEAKRIYDALAEGGNQYMPFQATFWSPGFGMCTDRFGIPWMVNTDGPPQG